MVNNPLIGPMGRGTGINNFCWDLRDFRRVSLRNGSPPTQPVVASHGFGF